MFKSGDAVVHPVRGAGVVERIVEREWRGSSRRYYAISLLNHPGTRVMIPASAADDVGLRPAVSEANLAGVWRVFEESPVELPIDHKERYKAIEHRLSSGSIVDVAGIVRDMAWRRRVKGQLTTKGARIYDEVMDKLVGEVAAAKKISVDEAHGIVRKRLASVPELVAAD